MFSFFFKYLGVLLKILWPHKCQFQTQICTYFFYSILEKKKSYTKHQLHFALYLIQIVEKVAKTFTQLPSLLDSQGNFPLFVFSACFLSGDKTFLIYRFFILKIFLLKKEKRIFKIMCKNLICFYIVLTLIGKMEWDLLENRSSNFPRLL